MFTFNRFEECRQAGLPKDAVDKSLRNVFHYSVNVDGLNDVLFVRFLPDVVQFFCENDEDEVSETGRGRMLASVSLRNAKETGNDLLFFADSDRLDWEQIKRNQEAEDGGDGENPLIACLKKLCDIYSQFPFASELKKNILKGDLTSKNVLSDEKKFKHVKSAFLKFCLLEFVSTVETEDEIFTLYPGFEAMRGKLRESKVYQMLNAKLELYDYRYKGRKVYSERNLTYLTRTYSDLLMDTDYNKMVPPTYYDGKGFFENPEMELSDLLQYKGDRKALDENVVRKIRNFLFTKHAIGKALGRCWVAKGLYCGMIICMGVFSLWATVAFLCYDNCPWDFLQPLVELFYNHAIVWDWVGLASVGVLIVLRFVAKSFDVFSPRILVTLAIGWLTAFISEDLIKSQVDIDRRTTILALIVVLSVVSILFFNEVKQHSPYYKAIYWKAIIRKIEIRIFPTIKFRSLKIIPVLSYSYFWALTIGAVMQFALYDNLLKSSNALSDIVYQETFNDADMYLSLMTDYRDALCDYEDKLESVLLSGSVVSGMSKDSDVHSSFLRLHSDQDYSRFKEVDATRMEVVKSRFNDLASFRNEPDSYLEKKRFKDYNWERLKKEQYGLASNDSLFIAIITDEKTAGNDLADTINSRLILLSEMIRLANAEMLGIKSFIADNNNWDTFKNWSKCETKASLQPNSLCACNCCCVDFDTANYSDYLKDAAIRNHNICRSVEMWWIPQDASKVVFPKLLPKQPKEIYPRMLLFHTLIVLIIAFVGQLVISDKSVTEPL